jgi:hypothetical protein
VASRPLGVDQDEIAGSAKRKSVGDGGGIQHLSRFFDLR